MQVKKNLGGRSSASNIGWNLLTRLFGHLGPGMLLKLVACDTAVVMCVPTFSWMLAVAIWKTYCT